MSSKLFSQLGLVLSSSVFLAFPVYAETTLKIALSSEPSSADPHYHKNTANDILSAHIFESLVERDNDSQIKPLLATEWKNIDDLTWEFKLRDGVKFSNGEPFTSKDVLFTICRTLNNKTNVTASFTDLTKNFTDVQLPDDKTVIIKTREPYPLMLRQLARQLPIISSSIVDSSKLTFDPANGCGLTAEGWPKNTDFNNGKYTIGTGPFVMKTFVPGTGSNLEKNTHYWGNQPKWDQVSLLFVTNAGSRLTGLLSGDYDLIENPSPRDLPRIKSNADLAYTITPSTRLIFFQPDVGRTDSPFSKDAQGKNPLQDLRVRQAINMAIDRNALVTRLLDGLGTVTTQYLPNDLFGALEKDPEVKFDPERAKKLLAEAGYPDGFSLTISTTNNRYIADAQVSQAVAQYLSRIGIKTTVDAMPSSVYFPKRAKLEFSFAIGGWPAEVADSSALFGLWVTSNTPEHVKVGLGTSNYGRFADLKFDEMFLKAYGTIDDEARKKGYQETTEYVLTQVPVIPLYFESSLWAYKKSLKFTGRRDQFTLAVNAEPAK